MILFLILNQFNIKTLNEKLVDFKNTKNKKIEKEFLYIYENIKPVGFNLYIEYLLLKKENKKIKQEIENILRILFYEIPIDSLNKMNLFKSVFDALVRLKDGEDFYKNLSDFVKILENKRKKKFKINFPFFEIGNILKIYGNIDSLANYTIFDKYLDNELLKIVRIKREEIKRKEKLVYFLVNNDLDSALNYAISNYEKALLYSCFEKLDKAERLFKIEYKDKNILPLFILLKSGENEDIKNISLKLLTDSSNLPKSDLSKLFYSLLFDTILQFKDKDLEHYFLYLNVEEEKLPPDTLLKKYFNTSTSFIIRNRKK